MKSVLDQLSTQSSAIILTLFALVVGLLVAVFLLSRRVRELQGRWGRVFEGARGEHVEEMLNHHLRHHEEAAKRLDELERRSALHEKTLKSTLRHVGLVRYDAFEEVGGAQSFALCVHDDEGNGVLMTSIVGRADCRVFCKPLLHGTSERTLSQEEQRALREARSEAPKTLISP